MHRKRYSIRYKEDGLKLLEDAIFDQEVHPHTTYFTGLDQPIDFQANRLMRVDLSENGHLNLQLQFKSTSYADIAVVMAFADQVSLDGQYSIRKDIEGLTLLEVFSPKQNLGDIESIFRNSFTFLHSPVVCRPLNILSHLENAKCSPTIKDKKWLLAPVLTQGDPSILHLQNAFKDIVRHGEEYIGKVHATDQREKKN